MKSRRRLIAFASTVLAGAALLLTACGEKKPELHIYNWSDYFDPATIRQFEEQYNCRVIYDVFESNESMYAKLKAGATGYDVVFPSSYQATIMHNEGMLEELDKSQLPNLKYIDPKFLKQVALDKDMNYSVPYMTGTTGVAVRTDKVDGIEQSWSVYDDADYKGRMTLLNDPREVLGAALKTLGYSLNTRNPAEVREAGEIVKRWKQNIAKFASDEYKPGIASGEFYIVQGYSGDVMQVMDEMDGDIISYFLPDEGFSFWADDMVILKDAPNKELAYAFINFMHDPQIAAMNMESNYYLSPNEAAYALLPQEMREDEMVFVPDEVMAHGEQIMPLGQDDQIYMDVWAKVKSEE